MNIKFVKYKEIGKIKSGKRLPKGFYITDKKTNNKYIRVRDINNNYIDVNNVSYITDEASQYLKKYRVNKNDIIISVVGTVGNIAQIPKELDGAYLTENCNNLLINEELCLKDYLKYYLTSELGKKEIKSHVVGSTQPKLPIYGIEDLNIILPTINSQKKISKLLNIIESKIKLNNKINDNLQKLMKQTYEQWFKKYKIPNITLKMKESDIGKIPEKWNIVKLKDVFFFQEGPGIRNWQYVEKNGTKFINIRCIKDNDLELKTANMISNDEAFGKYKHFLLDEWDVVVSTSGTLGRSQIIRKEHLPLCLNTSVIRFRPINNFKAFSFMYNYLTSNEFLNLLDILATGSAQRNFGPTHLNEITLLYPDEDTINYFGKIIFPVIKKIQKNKSQNIRLEQLRDTLLPKLMNGEIDLDKIEI